MRSSDAVSPQKEQLPPISPYWDRRKTPCVWDKDNKRLVKEFNERLKSTLYVNSLYFIVAIEDDLRP